MQDMNDKQWLEWNCYLEHLKLYKERLDRGADKNTWQKSTINTIV